jgi:nifR3 family TIM-barrel protein
MNIWSNLIQKRSKKGEPIVVLAPMADVTDVSFRRVIAKNGKPDVLWTEFVSADGLMLAPGDNPDEKGFTSQDKLRADLKFDPTEHPIVAQIFGSRPENIEKTAKLVLDLGFDGVDINMGCPDRSIEKQGCGSAMIKNPDSARKIIQAARKGVSDKIPVSVKTRLGYNQDQLEEWLPILLEELWDGPQTVVTIHARTRKQMSKVPADWTRVKRAVEVRDEFYQSDPKRQKVSPENRVLIFGNGDVKDIAEAQIKKDETGCDGVMIGRGIFGNPWLLGSRKREDVPVQERLAVLFKHTKLYEQELPFKSFALMKKHYKSYTEGMEGNKELRENLMKCDNSEDVERVINDYLSKL